MKNIAKIYQPVVCLWLALVVGGAALGQKPTPPTDSPRSVVGTWEGTLDVARLRLVLHIESSKEGALTGRLDSPDQGATDLPLDSVSVAGDTFRFEMKSLGAMYEGKLASDGDQLTGEFHQGGQAFPLSFKRTGRAATKSVLTVQKIDAGGHFLNMLIGGEGSPTVIFEAGFGAGLTSWATVQSSAARFARTVSYDRAGLGQSEAGPKPRAAKQIAAELHSALQKAGIAPPYVLVGHSFGGIYARVFADMYPREVAGMVLIDPSQESFDDWTKTHQEAQRAALDEEIAKIRAQVEEESKNDEQRIKASIGEESARIVAAAEQEITVAAAQARRGLRHFAADLAIEQAAKQLVLTPETDRALISEFVREATTGVNGGHK